MLENAMVFRYFFRASSPPSLQLSPIYLPFAGEQSHPIPPSSLIPSIVVAMAEDTKVEAEAAPVVEEVVVVEEKLEEEEISSCKVSDELADLEKKALQELKELISDALFKSELTKHEAPTRTSEQQKPVEAVVEEKKKLKEDLPVLTTVIENNGQPILQSILVLFGG